MRVSTRATKIITKAGLTVINEKDSFKSSMLLNIRQLDVSQNLVSYFRRISSRGGKFEPH